MKSLVIRVLSDLHLLNSLLSIERAAKTRFESVRAYRSRPQTPELRRLASTTGGDVIIHAGRPLIATTNVGFDHLDHRESIADAVLEGARSAGALAWKVASDVHGRTRIAVAGDRSSTIEALKSLHPTLAIGYRNGDDPLVRQIQALGTAPLPRLARRPIVVITQPVLGSNGAVDVADWGACELEEWKHEAIDGCARFVATAPNPVASWIPASRLATRERDDHASGPFPPRIEELDPPFDIDIVYTWVDGHDAEWQQRRTLHVSDDDRLTTLDGTTDDRFWHSDELRYSLRSLWYFARFFRHVYLVTDRQRPSWLTSSERISLVDHREIFTRRSALPVFNSHAIESNLHRVPQLADRYLYMNDDVFFGRPTPWTNFFDPAGGTKFAVSEAKIPIEPDNASSSVDFAGANAQRLLLETFGWAPTRKVKHTPHPQNKEIILEMERRWPELFESVGSSRFRSRSDVSIAAFLHHYYAFATGRAHVSDMDYDYIHLNRADLGPVLTRTQRCRPEVFCVNDGPMDSATRASAEATLTRSLQEMYPHPAPWELDAP